MLTLNQITLDDVYAAILNLRRQPSAATVPGAVFTIRFPIGITSGVLSSTIIPANAVATRAPFHVTTPFLPAAGTTMWAGVTGATGLFVAGATASIAATAGTYVSTIDAALGGTPGQVLYSVVNAPTAGAGTLAIEYTIPLS